MTRATFFITTISAFLCASSLLADPGDTTIVQTFTHAAQNNPNTAYDSPGRRWFEFPASDNGIEYQKVLLYYNLKCFEDGTAGNLGFPCGEWDYLTYTYIYDHTGVLDSTLATHPLYLVNNADFDQVTVTPEMVTTIQQMYQDLLVIDESISESVYEMEGPTTSIAGPLTTQQRQRTQYLYLASELAQWGLQPGDDIRKLAMQLNGAAADFSDLRIRMASTSLTSLQELVQTSFTEVYHLNTSIAGNGWHEFILETPFTWDGASNVIVDWSYNHTIAPANTPLCEAIDAGFNAMAASAGDDRYISMDWQDEVKIPAAAFEQVSDQISIVLWNFGDPNAQPQDGTLFEGRGAQNQRILNVHLPWSNGRIYWDAGNDGGYDRIDKAAGVADYEGKWNHWCFTKNTTTGSMKIYKNGVLWHSGTNLDNTMEGIVEFSLGGAVTWNNFYNGRVDEFAVFNTELDAATIAAWMNQDLNSSHPAWSNLQVYYNFNESNGEQIVDHSGNDHHAWMHGNADRKLYDSRDLWRNSGPDSYRPQTRFYTGEYVTHVDSILVEVVTEIPPVSIVSYAEENDLPAVQSVEYQYIAAPSTIIDPNGVVIASSNPENTTVINNSDFEYYQAPFEVIDRYELNRFITMYGIQLDLGPDGWTWVTDVTDWLPLLRDSVELESGNWQELLDMKFLFIEGEAARDVTRVERVWDANLGLNNFDNVIVNTTIEKQAAEEGWKLITTNTGHGFGNDNNNCGEFCNNMQYVQVNDQTQWSWDILQECADNPLYPQGGTWIYDRAGWCPGMNSAMQQFELTPFVAGQNEFTIDYDITSDPYGNYVFFGTLIGYGPIKHEHDPEIDMITAPSDWKIHSRWNPMCDEPRFILRNKGASPLTDLNIYYGVIGGTQQAYHWTGNLGFMESEEIVLEYDDPILWSGDDEQTLEFQIELGYSADGVDENTSNNVARNSFVRPPVYQYSDLDDNRLIIQLKTNAANWESEYTLYDADGNIVFQRLDFPAANTTYRDTIQINAGCYKFHLRDSDDDGISFFANDDGNGNCKLDRVAGGDFINFETDFGKEIVHYFQWNTNIVSVEEQSALARATMKAVPNPTRGDVQLRIAGLDRQVTCTVLDMTGKVIYSEMHRRLQSQEDIKLPASQWANGLYLVQVSDGKQTLNTKICVE